MRVPLIGIDEAGEKVKAIYADIESVKGMVSPPMQRFANDPGVLHVQWQLDKVLMHGESTIPRRLRQYISLTTAILYGCGD